MYIMRNNGGGDERVEDALSDTQRKTLKLAITQTNFAQVLDSGFTDMCPITYDGVAYQYDIEYEGLRYEFDSCINDLEKEKLFEVLMGYFEIFQITHGTI